MNKRNNKAITLIALVVTIVVLLILAGVSISMLTGENGIITQAQNSKNENKRGEIEEQVRLAVMAAKTAGLGEIDFDTLNSELIKIGYDGNPITKENDLPKDITIKGVTIRIDKDTVTSETTTEDDNKDIPTLPAGKPGQTYETETKVSIGNDEVVIPGGATISGIAGEYEDVNEGLVIYIIPEDEEVTDWNADSDNNGIIDVQEKYDQFVWIPVPNAILNLSENTTALSTEADIKETIQAEIDAQRYPMAIKIDETNYLGVLYQFSLDSTKNTVLVEPYSDWTPLCESSTKNREPAYLTDSSLGDASDYNKVGITQSSLQTEFNTMVEKVAKNEGFWVGRYETSDMNSSSANDLTQQVSVVKGTITGTRIATWYRMYAQQKNYSNLVDITSTSTMLWGSQWDQIMIWMKEVKNETSYAGKTPFYVINSQGMGNYGTSYGGTGDITNTGYYAVKNIYDLSGNLYDWTLESNSSNSRLWRGGNWRNTDESDARADHRNAYPTFVEGTYGGSRVSLY